MLATVARFSLWRYSGWDALDAEAAGDRAAMNERHPQALSAPPRALRP
jgi:hypothetical protein